MGLSKSIESKKKGGFGREFVERKKLSLLEKLKRGGGNEEGEEGQNKLTQRKMAHSKTKTPEGLQRDLQVDCVEKKRVGR